MPFSWVVGEFGVRMLLDHAPSRALEVRWHGGWQGRERDVLASRAEALHVPFIRDDRSVEAARSKGSAHVMAFFEKHEASLRPGRRHLALLQPREAGNAGATLRTALAMGVEDVAFIGGVDPWSPHVVRASVGCIFAVRIARSERLEDFAGTGPKPWLLHAAAKRTLEEVPRGVPDARVVVGPEWPGFAAADLAWGEPVAIAMDGRVESLNVAVAVGLALHWLRGPVGTSLGGREAPSAR